ncbi:phage/plasmid primase, P4 family, partial [Chloroflexota bacterium]
MSDNNAMLKAALSYAAQGFKVFPLKPGGKTPITAYGVKDATQLQATVKEYWQKYPNANIGLCCDGLLVLDFDGKAGAESKRQLTAKDRELPRTWLIRTGGGTQAEPKEQGEHYVYRVSKDLNIRPGAGKYGYQNLDIRANDSYIVAVPSITRLPYETIDDTPVADAPGWLIEMARNNGSKPVSKKKQGTPIPETTRNATLTSTAGAMRRKGADQATIEAALLEINAGQCQPPLPERDVIRIAGSVARYEPAVPPDNKSGFDDTDTGNAERFAAIYGNVVRFIEEYNCFAIYTGKYWRIDLSGNAILALSKEVARSYYQDAAEELDDNRRAAIVKHAKQSHSQHRRKAMIELLKSEPGISVKINDFDNDLYLLNCRNGTVDLTNGDLRSHNKADMITKYINLDYIPDATSEVWQQFLESTFQGNTAMIDYCQCSLGYSSTASMATMACFLPYGQGWNGKSTLLGAVGDTLGPDYSTEVDPAAFTVSQHDRGGGPNESIAALYKIRFVRSTEIKDGQKLSTDIIKRATGGETLRHNRKYQHEFEFTPTFKLWLSGNHKATITDSTDSIWLRLKQIPFKANFRPGQQGFIPNLRQVLKQPEHQRAILAWLVVGAVAWFSAGQQLDEPEEVVKATLDYRQDQDILADFLTEK